MKNWFNFEEEKPIMKYGNVYEFLTERNTRFGIEQNIIPVIWNGNDWYLFLFESISGYEGISGNKYFKEHIPKFWRENGGSNLAT